MLSLMRKAQAIWSDESGAAAVDFSPDATVAEIAERAGQGRRRRPAQTAPVRTLAPRRPKIGLALGAGAARGWSHIGILRELEAVGFKPDVIAGTSIGALVGGCYAAGELDAHRSSSACR